MSALEDVVADWPHTKAAPVLRVAGIMRGRDGEYWRTLGRSRFARELAQDGLDPAQVEEVIAAGDHYFRKVNLTDELAAMIARVTGEG